MRVVLQSKPVFRVSAVSLISAAIVYPIIFIEYLMAWLIASLIISVVLERGERVANDALRMLPPAAPHADYPVCRLATGFLARAAFVPFMNLIGGLTLRQNGVAW